jgi:hypothetical protein
VSGATRSKILAKSRGSGAERGDVDARQGRYKAARVVASPRFALAAALDRTRRSLPWVLA